MSWNWRWWDEYTDAQLAALKTLVMDITARHKIPLDADHILPAYRLRLGSEPGPALNLFWQRAGSPQREALFR
jgi:N-acetyl-anhydromuramyl-L-alanine amidase AmpD